MNNVIKGTLQTTLILVSLYSALRFFISTYHVAIMVVDNRKQGYYKLTESLTRYPLSESDVRTHLVITNGLAYLGLALSTLSLWGAAK